MPNMKMLVIFWLFILNFHNLDEVEVNVDMEVVVAVDVVVDVEVVVNVIVVVQCHVDVSI